MRPVSEGHPLRRFFAGAVEYAFCAEAGVCEPYLTDYMCELLVRFTHIDQLSSLHHLEGKSLDQLAKMLAVATDEEADSPLDRDRNVYRSMGDFSLFWTGLYPEQLSRSLSASPNRIADFIDHGKRSYAIVSELSDDQQEPPPRLFRLMSREFECCVFGLGLVRRLIEESTDEWPDAGGGPLLL